MILRSVRRGGAAAIAAACFAAVSCSVYDASLLGNGTSDVAGSGDTGGAGTSGATGQSGNGGAGGKPTVNAGASGAAETGGMSPDAGAAGADESGEAGSAGRAVAGSGGTSGGGGTAGGAAGGGPAGAGGTAGAIAGGAGTGGAPVAMGCGKLSVPLDDANDRAHFVITLPTNANMSTAGTIAMRLYVAAGSGGTVFNYVQDQNNRYFGNATRSPIASSVNTWTTLTWDVTAQPDSTSTPTYIDKTMIHRVGIEVNSSPSTAWTAPTLIYVDSIIVTSPTVTYTYTLDTAGTVYTTPTPSDQIGLLWFNNDSSDTKAANVTLAWQTSCP